MAPRVLVKSVKANSTIGVKIQDAMSTATKKVGLMIVGEAINTLAHSHGGVRLGLSRKAVGGQYAHVATGNTIRSFKVIRANNGHRVVFGGASYTLQHGIGPTSVSITDIRAWASIKFPGMPAARRERMVYNIRRRIARNGLQPTYFITNSSRTVREYVRRPGVLRRTTVAAIEAANAQLLNTAERGSRL
jgi:hypothetical protein